MDSTLLEQGVFLALGWRERVTHLETHPSELSEDDKPAGIPLSNTAFIALQKKLATEACQWWEQEIKALLKHFNAEHDALSKKQKALVASVEQGKIKATQANEKARALSGQLEAAAEQIGQTQKLLTLLKQAPDALPRLPLCRYSVSNHNCTKEYQAQKKELAKNDKTHPWKAAGWLHALKTAFFKLSLTDRIALSLALLFSALIVVGGAAFTLRDEGISLSLKENASGHYDVAVINRSRQLLSLIVPYDGAGLEKTDPPSYGIVVELLTKGQPPQSDLPLEHLWFYKEKAAWLKGSILLTPLSEEKLELHLPADSSEDTDTPTTDQIRFTVYKAPKKKKAVYTFTTSPESSAPESE